MNKPPQPQRIFVGSEPEPELVLRSGTVTEWSSPAYDVLTKHNLLKDTFRVESYADLHARIGNSTPFRNCLWEWITCCFPPCMPCKACLNTAEVPEGSIRAMEDGRGGFHWLGNGGKLAGIHLYWDCFYRIGDLVSINEATTSGGRIISNGSEWIVIVPQGHIGLAEDMGQPVLLPPGMHQWSSSTLFFKANVDLAQPVIHLGPYTLLTVDKGYEAVTQNNGKQEVLPGGAMHLLTHRNHKFEKFITTKIQTDDLKRIECMTGDNVLMQIDGTVCWQIDDVQLCAERAAETMHTSKGSVVGHDGKLLSSQNSGTIVKLREDVLKQADASLSALVGKVNFSDTMSPNTIVQTKASGLTPTVSATVVEPSSGSKTPSDSAAILFNVDKLQDAVTHANDMCVRYGVQVLSINIISAKPSNDDLMQSLAKGAVAAAEAQQLETTARGQAAAAQIIAKGEADAEVTRADGARSAAKMLEEHEVAVELAKIGATGEALSKSGSTLILGDNPSAVGSMLLANPNILKQP